MQLYELESDCKCKRFWLFVVEMTTPEDTVEETKALAECSEVSGPRDDRVRTLNLMDVDPPDTGLIASEQIVEAEAGGETVCCEDKGQHDIDLDCHEKEKSSVECLTLVLNGENGTEMDVYNGSLNGVGERGDIDGQKSSESDTKGVDVELDGDEQRGVNGCEMEDQDHEFLVGDFIWGKIKSHPWWPGQVHDPRDASEFAVKHGQEGRILVAFFGDGSCSWCTPSQLRPFVENFETMSKDSSSKSFLYAVKRALGEIGRLVESEMTCNCTSKGKEDRLARPVVDNAGVKAGVLVPQVDVGRLFLNLPEPGEILSKLKNFAEDVSFDNEIELTVLASWLSAFYRFKDGYSLLPYREPLPVEGLEDENEKTDAITNDFSVPIAVPILGPLDEDGLSSPLTDSLKAEAHSDDKIYHRRKQKSVAELMGENTHVKSKIHKRSMDSEVGKSDSNLKQRKTNDAIGESSQRASSIGKPGKKRKVELSLSPRIKSKKAGRSENGSVVDVHGAEQGPSVEKPEDIDTSVSEDNSPEAKEELEVITSPRERKKSKYLSPPYTNLELRIGYLRPKVESEIESNKVTKITHVEDHKVCETPPSDSADKLSTKEKMHSGEIDGGDMSINTETPRAKSDQITLSVSNANAPVDALLSEIQFAAVDPLYLSKVGSLDMVWDFVSALRGSTFLQGSDYETPNEFETGQKRKSPSAQLASIENNISEKKTKRPNLKPCKEVAQKTAGKSGASNSKEAPDMDAGLVAAENVEEKAPTRLILTFAPEIPLPSKNDIVNLFSAFGSLNERETEVLTDSRSVHIAYMKESDAVAAFKSSVSQNPFGSGNVNYRLLHCSARPRSHSILSPGSQTPGKENAVDDLMSDVDSIKQKLGIMTEILANYHSKFLPEDKSSLKDEMKHLMQQVEVVSEKVRTMAEQASAS